ncbi:MAG: hypothetical protein RI957_519, partial [Verrucomicrobiota bacterium]
MLRWLIAVAMVMSALSSGLHAQSIGRSSLFSRNLMSQEVVPHEIEGNDIRFTLSSPPLSLTLQGMNADSGRWRNLQVVPRPSTKLNRIKIPRGWQKSDLRVIASYVSVNSRRETIASTVDTSDSSVNFSARRSAKFYSIEARPNAK